MSDWRQLKGRDLPEISIILRWLTFLSAVAIGVYLGWKLFLSPLPSATMEPTPTTTREQASITSRPEITVQQTGTPSSSLGKAVQVGLMAPDFTLLDLNDKPHSLSAYLGGVVLINFWTTWCPPCRAEMPALQQVYEKYQAKGFTVLGINLTEVDDRQQIAPFAQEFGLTFPILLDKNSDVSEDLYQLLGLPTSVFVGRNGTVREIYIGALQLENLGIKVQSLLEETP